MSAIVYIEGGGDRNENLARLCRRSWRKFFEAAGLRGRLPKVVRGGSRSRTIDLFLKATADPDPVRVPLLLVDSEESVQEGRSVWQHLRARERQIPPCGAGDDRAFLMVQVMETWFLADRTALRQHFGPRFREDSLQQWPRLEEVPKATVIDALGNASKNCSSPYTKGTVSFQLLAKIDPGLVEAACPHAKRLLEYLRIPQ